jgi:hypothetical protein
MPIPSEMLGSLEGEDFSRQPPRGVATRNSLGLGFELAINVP